MTFNQSVKFCFTKGFLNIQGRASRSEYWWFALCHVCLGLVAAILDAIMLQGIGILPLLVVLLFAIPLTTAGIRRLHDLDRSGWWSLISFVPLIGGIILLVWFVSKGTAGRNHFGEVPQ